MEFTGLLSVMTSSNEALDLLLRFLERSNPNALGDPEAEHRLILLVGCHCPDKSEYF